jgi:hypothetical protein
VGLAADVCNGIKGGRDADYSNVKMHLQPLLMLITVQLFVFASS